MDKIKYEEPIIEIIAFSDEDIITTSGDPFEGFETDFAENP